MSGFKYSSIQSAVAWTYLGMAPIVIAAALPPSPPTTTTTTTTTTASGEVDVDDILKTLELRSEHESDKGGDDAGGDDSDDDPKVSWGSKQPPPAAAASTTTAAAVAAQKPTPTGEQPRMQNAADENREHWMIAVGSVVAFIVISLTIFALWKWRAAIVRRFRRRPAYDPSDNKMSESPATARSLFGGFEESRVIAIGHVPAQPSPAFDPTAPIPPTHGRSRSGDQTFFLEDDADAGHRAAYAARSRKSSKNSITLTIQVPDAHTPARGQGQGQGQYANFVPPPIPDSPEHARNNSRFSWATAQSVQSADSEPARFRTIDSWVGHQAERVHKRAESRGTAVAASSGPSTPAAFREHPGQEVKLASRHGRMESNDLDRRLNERER